jgi:predicted ATP-dependent protease
VVAAVQQGQFHLWGVKHIDEGIEILTGVRAGERLESGEFPEDTVNGRVDRRLKELAERMVSFGRPNEKS